MIYETPELTALTAISAIQANSTIPQKTPLVGSLDCLDKNDSSGGYADWE